MQYTVMNPQPSGLLPNETAVTLDTGDMVALNAVCGIESNTGNPSIVGAARVINADGTDKLDAIGQPITSGFSHVTNATEIAQVGTMAGVQKCVLLAMLGESTAPLWQDPIHQTILQNASIRTNLASAAHAGPVNAGSLL